ncbi:MAG: ACP S-malonyltransferase [Spirochaetaceae bacterium]|jgi:[acyl-carrier-protein] S-malonyltransferase|nr:ACP S-malonyltransferase [Spirochaetaceae bacterium]
MVKLEFNKPAFLFPGQGSQYQGMALDLYEESAGVRDVFARASEIFHRDMKKLLAEAGEDELKNTEIAQCAVTLANLSSAAFLAERGVRAVCAAGHSLGEYAALHEAGIISLDDCFALVRERGKAMAAHGISGAGMAAVLGISPEAVEKLINEWSEAGLRGVYAANFNSNRQTVISGTVSALAEVETRFKEAGARRVLALKVSGPFHSPLMKEAADAFAAFLQTVHFNEPRIPFFSNVSGKRVTNGAQAKEYALRQITAPVRWIDEEAEIAAAGIDAALETGPGKALCGLWADTGSSIPCFAAGTVAALMGLGGLSKNT